jgi:hypothetical protein
VHVLVEGPSEAAWIPPWFKRFLPGHYVTVYPHQGKGRLRGAADPGQRGVLDQLRPTLIAFAARLSSQSDRVLVLLDRDSDDCTELASRVRSAIKSWNLPFIAKVRIAVVEAEAFFLGDPKALKLAWPTADLKRLNGRNSDLDWDHKLFMDVIGTATVNKLAWARAIAPHLGVTVDGSGANRSPSFRAFARALRDLCEG